MDRRWRTHSMPLGQNTALILKVQDGRILEATLIAEKVALWLQWARK
jgi:ketosteroid isomerase-like protein